MNGLGKNDISLEKSDLESDKSPILSSKATMFAHQATGGELTIDLNNLTTPPEYAANGFTNPNPSEIASLNLAVFKKRLRVVSSLNGELIQFDTFKVIGPSKIALSGDYQPEGLDAGEIIVGYIEQIQTLTLPESRLKRRTFIMTEGQTVINLGLTYEVGQGLEEGHNIGAIRVTRLGKTIYRNTGNVAASPSADGGYHEASGTTIELNIPAIAGELIDVELGCVAPSGDAEFFSALESLSGAVLALSTDVAQAAHGDNDVSRYLDANPSEIDRRAFGDKVLLYDTDQKLSEYTKTKWQRKTMTTVYSGANLGVMSELTFNNLKIGQRYKVRYLLRLLGNYNNVNAIFQGFVTNGIQTRQWGHSFWLSNQGLTLFHEINWEFTAEATTLTIQVDQARGNESQNSNSQVRPEDTYALLEEVKNYAETNEWD